jgi:SNF2 family DNA or RNA helicase
LKNAFLRGGEMQLEAAKSRVHRNLGLDYAKIEHIIQHRKYKPFLNEAEIMRRIAKDTIVVKRSDVFNTKHEQFVHEPIKKPVELSNEAKQIANALVDLGFTDKLVLGKAPALELLIRLQDVCNGFEPIEHKVEKVIKGEKEVVREIEYRPLAENAKLEMLMDLLNEIGVEKSQVAIFASRTKMLEAVCDRLQKEDVSYVRYDGNARDSEKAEAEKLFERGEAQVFCANPSSAAYGLNCLANCSYLVWLCIDGSVEKEYQARHRLLRGQLTAPKIAYAIYAKGSIEERQWETLRVGQELIGAENYKETFMVA